MNAHDSKKRVPKRDTCEFQKSHGHFTRDSAVINLAVNSSSNNRSAFLLIRSVHGDWRSSLLFYVISKTVNNVTSRYYTMYTRAAYFSSPRRGNDFLQLIVTR